MLSVKGSVFTKSMPEIGLREHKLHTMPSPRCPSSLAEFYSSRAAYRAFFFTHGAGGFWGANAHNEGLVRALHQLVPELKGQSVIDVGAGRYNTQGGDISHFMLFHELWGCPSLGGVILGFEPVPRQFKLLAQELNRTSSSVKRPAKWPMSMLKSSLRTTKAADGHSFSTFDGTRRCAHLSDKALSDRIGNRPLANMPFAGDNTASLDSYFHHENSPLVRRRQQQQLAGMSPELQRQQARQQAAQLWSRRQQRMRPTSTLDAQLEELGALAGWNDVLLLKVDVEGHEEAVLSGADSLLRSGRRVHVLILEYGHSTSRDIWDALKATDRAEPAASSPQDLRGNSLWRMQQWASARGFETFYLGGGADRPVLVPVSSPSFWDDRFEVCMDKLSKYSPDNITWWK